MSSIWTIRRSAADTKLTGLCSGVAHHWGVDPVLVRVGWALLALSGGIGLVLYVAGWLLIPVDGHDKAPVDDFFGSTGRRWPKEVWIALVVIACLTVFTLFGSLSPFGVGPAVVFAAIWYFGFYRDRTPRPSAEPPSPPAVPPALPLQFVRYPGPPTPFTEAADAWRQRIEEARRPVSSPRQPAADAWPTIPPTHTRSAISDPPVHEPLPDPEIGDRQAFLAHADPVGLYAEPVVGTAPPPIRRTGSLAAKRLRLVSLIVLGLVLGGLGVLDAQGVEVSLAGYLAAALLVVGLTLLAATWFGRTRGLIPVGLLLVGAVLATAPISSVTQLDDGQPRTNTYTQVAELPVAGDSIDVGLLRVDLSQLQLSSDTSYRAQVGAGRLEVRVPPDVNVVLNYRIGAGMVTAYGTPASGGTDLRSSVSDPGVPDRSQPTLTLDLGVDLGELQVRR